MRSDTHAASPLAVIATFVFVAIGVTALVFFLFVDTGAPQLEFQQVDGGFEVVRARGDLAWRDLEIQFVDRAGTDHAAALALPGGDVAVGERVLLQRELPGGPYLLLVRAEGRDLARLVVTL